MPTGRANFPANRALPGRPGVMQRKELRGPGLRQVGVCTNKLIVGMVLIHVKVPLRSLRRKRDLAVPLAS